MSSILEQTVVSSVLAELASDPPLARWVQDGLALHSGERQTTKCQFCGNEFSNETRHKYEAHFNLAILLRRLKFYKESLDELEKATILITDSEGASNRQRYVFDVMNDVTRTILTDDDKKYLLDRVGDEVVKDGPITYVHGKVVSSKDLDRAIVKNFKTCGSKKIFLDND